MTEAQGAPWGFVLERRHREFSRARQEANGKVKAWIFVILLPQCK